RVKRDGTHRRALAVKLQYLDVRGPQDIEAAFRAASKGRADAVIVLGGPVIASQRTQIVDLVVKRRLPAIYQSGINVEAERAHGLLREVYRLGPACVYLRGQDSKRRKARRSPSGAAEEVRANH